ncbi:MAG: hypothetical protein MK089_02830 [Phycisphaerales bacterium]|nr:hypothetical protein [Phycisphaerales bacterium]
MAIRSTAGTGVVVALVVFIIVSAALLTTTIIFYSQRGKLIDDAATAKKNLDDVATSMERGSEPYKAIESVRGRDSVYGYLNNQYKSLQDYVGSPVEIDTLKQNYSDNLGVDPNTNLYTHLQNSRRQIQENADTIKTLKSRISQLQESNDRLVGDLAVAEDERNVTLEASVDSKLAGIRQADSKYEQEVAKALDGLQQAKDRNRTRYVGQIRDLETEVDRLSDENVRGQSTIEELRSLVDRSKIKPKDPAALVDGEIIEVTGRGDQVYINRGTDDQIVLGMIFQVYDDAAQVRPDEDGNFPEGKATIQVVKVGDTTATAKVTRATRGRPVVSNDVIVNPFYDPNYTFKFLVHGNFDIDADGRATSAEREYIERQIQSWGGTVISGNEITGDLDFLVLGVEPSNPQNPSANATQLEMQQILDQRMTHQQYNDLFNAAKKADIPVLNANRLYILTGKRGI